VVNTCAFIESAKCEGIETILELAALKKEGELRKIVVAGCMAQRYRDEIKGELPEIDGLVGCGSFGRVVTAVEEALGGRFPVYFDDIDAPVGECERVVTSPRGWAYLKLSEGCDNRCAYCVIPSIRGRHRSRTMESLLTEAHSLVANGAKELILIAQDSTYYGMDLYGKRALPELVKQLCAIEELEWLRLHYLYPDGIDDELIGVLEREEKVVRYLDIPIQHVNDGILSAMNRRYGRADIEGLFAKLRARLPGLILRTTVIVGFPGEGERESAELCAFLKKEKVERAGVFPYSQEEGTAAALLPNQLSDDVKARRVEVVMGIQQRVMDAHNRRMRGSEIAVLCEGYDDYAGCHYGRSWADSPEVDGKVFFRCKRRVPTGEMVRVRVTGRVFGDLKGVVSP